MQEVLGYTPEQAGFALLPLTAPFLVAVPIGRRLGSRFDPRVPILLGLGLSIVSFVLLTSVDKDLHYSDLLPSILLLGVGSGLCVTAMNAAPMNAIADAKAGQAAGILQMTTGLGSVLGITLGGALFQEMHERRLTDFLRAADGRSIPEATQHQLTGALVHSPPAERALARFDTQTAATIIRGIREAFVFGVSSTMWLSVGALCVGVVAAITLMRRASLTVSS
jgi:fucose permease